MASNFSMIPIRWLLTVDSEMAFFLFHSLAEGVLEKFIAKLVNSKVNFTQKTDIVLIALCFMRYPFLA